MDEFDAHIRAADEDRRAVTAALERAHAEGRIDLGEFDERARQAYQARTYGELAAITADLPKRTTEPAAEPPRRVVPLPVHRRHPVASWATAVTVNLVIWAAISLAHHDFVYPWWLWLAGPWGLALVARQLSGRTPHSL